MFQFVIKMAAAGVSSKTKILHDAIHPHMKIPAICHRIIETPTFQRLKNLKQLATCYYIYPSASHNRYEHCIGACCLAGEYGRILQKKQPDMQINEKDILCLEIAGLCHDLGHGPFSHTWEHFLKQKDKTSKLLFPDNEKYCHEDTSKKLFDHMVDENNLKEDFQKEGLTEKDLLFIKSLIGGKRENMAEFGREAYKGFLYDIVANEISKIDVDKFDYLLRDCTMLNLTTSFDYRRVMTNSMVLEILDDPEEKTRWRIVYRKKVAHNLEDLFRGRYRMHQVAYQHKVNKLVEQMLVDGFTAANDTLIIPGAEAGRKLSNAHEDPKDFIKLSDGIFEIILNKWAGDSDVASSLFKKISRGEHYPCLGYVTGTETDKEQRNSLKKIPFIKLLKAKSSYGGKKNDSPLKHQYFYEEGLEGDDIVKLSKDFENQQVEIKYYIVFRPENRAANFTSQEMEVNKGNLITWAKEQEIGIQIIHLE